MAGGSTPHCPMGKPSTLPISPPGMPALAWAAALQWERVSAIHLQLQPNYLFSAGVKFDIDEYSYFTIQADHTIQGSFNETVGGALYSYKLGDEPDYPLYTLSLGGFLRWKDALIPVLKIQKNPLSLAISYDVNVSQLKTASQGRGAFELSLSYIGFLDRHNSSRDKVLCPRF